MGKIKSTFLFMGLMVAGIFVIGSTVRNIEAEEIPQTENGLCYEILDDGTVEITDYLHKDLTDGLIIPEEIEGRIVTSIGWCAFQDANFTSIDIPETVTKIGQSAFSNCKNLLEVNLPVGIKTIMADTFRLCSKLERVTMPDSVTSIGQDAFNQCRSLNNIEIPSNVTKIYAYAFVSCTSLTSLKLPPGLTKIDYASFSGCESLTYVKIPEGVTEIEDEAFENSKSLEYIELPSTLTKIGTYAFHNGGLKSIEIPASVRELGYCMFSNNLKTIYFIGDAPEMVEGGAEIDPYGPLGTFENVEATAYYPANNPTWDDAINKTYGGPITWLPIKTPDKISLDITSIDLSLGGTQTLTANVTPEDSLQGRKVHWKSSDENIASVDENGIITGNSAGKVIITAYLMDKKAECQVTVYPLEKIALNHENIELQVEDQQQLEVIFTPDDAVKGLTVQWTASDPHMASVDENGLVTANMMGTSIITASILGKEAQCRVDIKPKPIAINTVVLNTRELNLVVGSSDTLTAKIIPENTTLSQELTWSSSDPSVAIVENGEVTAVKEGVATISVTTVNGKTASCQVNVTKESIQTPFIDIKSTDWFYDYVVEVYKQGIMTGKDEVTFAPSESLSRAQFAVILYRMEGEPDVSNLNSTTFPDVPEGIWYDDAVTWANANGIINGYTSGPDAGKFGASDNITRAQMATMMYRYAAYKNYDTTADGDLNSFQDASSVPDFAIDGMAWAVGKGIITGDQGNLNPQGVASRAVGATIITRFLDQIA